MKAARLPGSKAASAGARRQLPAWLAALALACHLLAPGLCLAQMLSGGPLGAICSVGKISAGGSTLPDAEATAAHALDNCSHCLATSAVITHSAPYSPAFAPHAATSHWQPALVRLALRSAWRPPPRGPPATASA